MRLFNGGMIDLPGDELERFFVYAYKITRHTRALITFGMPVLFLVGGLHDTLMAEANGPPLLLRRSILVAGMLLCASLVQMRVAMCWRELAGISWCLLCSIAIMLTTVHDPARLSLVHVVITLMGIILLPHALRPLAAAGVLLVGAGNDVGLEGIFVFRFCTGWRGHRADPAAGATGQRTGYFPIAQALAGASAYRFTDRHFQP